MKKDEKRFTLRMELELFEKISEIADKERRSIASQIEIAIEEFIERYEEYEHLKSDNSSPF